MATTISGKKKTKVILKIAKNFLAYHPQKGKPTNFEMKIKAKDKIHTIRPNYEASEKNDLSASLISMICNGKRKGNFKFKTSTKCQK